MQIQGFTKLSQEEQETTYGGWAWLVAMIPMLVQTTVTAVASFKSIFSDKGSIKGENIQAAWDNKPSSTTSSKKTGTTNVSYYAY
ncbi:hypothetical protein [Candidatus Mycoplasma mahonii]|uniref:hypothetical protein n=1 Tax=Candidatus Mycoplasma mahonii TaxID=3004105 RepID=UPI0026EF1E2E|nr:hypothetical protein [Candidatus Mycoplasma mahonii]WKX02329.1 hypothetical protein O3I44_02895 [Candidatus Mycoplasma mahonii]